MNRIRQQISFSITQKIISLSRFFLSLLFPLFFLSISYGQTNSWTAGTGNWNVPSNWSLNIPPTADHDVDIGASDNVTVPAGFEAVAKSVNMDGGSLTIAATGSLSINGTTGNGLYMESTGAVSSVVNNGTLNLGNSSSIMNNAIVIMNGSSFTNNSLLEINNITLGIGIQLNNGIFENTSILRIGNSGAVNSNGVYLLNASSFINSGTLEINNTTIGNGIVIIGIPPNNGTFENTGMLKIGNSGAVKGSGMYLSGTSSFTNSGTLEIDNITDEHGIRIRGSSILNNSGTIKIGETVAPNQLGIFNMETSTITNTSSGLIEIYQNNAYDGWQTQSDVVNNGTIKIGTDGGSIARDGLAIAFEGSFTQGVNALLEINNTGRYGLRLTSLIPSQIAKLTNAGTIKIGDNGSIASHGLYLDNPSDVDNQSGGIIEISNVAVGHAMSITDGFNSFSNHGSITFGNTAPVITGIDSPMELPNAGTMVFKDITNDGLTAGTKLSNSSGGTIEVPIGGKLQINASAILTNNSMLANNGTIKGEGTIAQSGDLAFTTGSILAPGNSPGTIAFTGNFDFGSGTYHAEVFGTIQNTDYDLITANGTATLTNATLDLDLGSFTPSSGQIFTIISANNLTGAFISDNLPTDWFINYNNPATGDVTLSFGAALPVELVYFWADLNKKKQVNLEWQTASEENNSGFQIEHSNNTHDWQVLGFVEGKGTTSLVQNYNYIDSRPVSGDNYYRLKQIDFGGQYEYSEVRTVKVGGSENKLLEIFPNPSRGQLTLNLHNPNHEKACIKLFDNAGNLIWLKDFGEGEAVSYWEKQFNLPEREVYFVMTQVGSQVETQKVTVISEK